MATNACRLTCNLPFYGVDSSSGLKTGLAEFASKFDKTVLEDTNGCTIRAQESRFGDFALDVGLGTNTALVF